MSQTRFEYDVFLSHSSKDKQVVRELAERLKSDGLRVWLDEWTPDSDDDNSLKIQQGIEQSRTLVICMSPDFFASEWAKLEQYSLLFRDSTNQQRLFIPLLLADCPIPEMIVQFKYIDWQGKSDENYRDLLTACLSRKETISEFPKTNVQSTKIVKEVSDQAPKKTGNKLRIKKPLVLEGHKDWIHKVVITNDEEQIISCSGDKTLRIWDSFSGDCVNVLKGHSDLVYSFVTTPDNKQIISCSDDKKIRVWDSASGQCLNTLKGHSSPIGAIAITPDGKYIVSGSLDGVLCVWDLASANRLYKLTSSTSINNIVITRDGSQIIADRGGDLTVWDLESGKTINYLKGHSEDVNVIDIVSRRRKELVVSGSLDCTLRIWNLMSGECLAILHGHSNPISAVCITPDKKKFVSGSSDGTIRLWDLVSGQCLHILEGHSDSISTVSVTKNGKYIVSGSLDSTIRLWDLASGRCLNILRGHLDGVTTVAVTSDGKRVISGARDNTIRVWDITELKSTASNPIPGLSFFNSKRYTNAKVALIGDSGVGKTGLAIRLIEDRWEVTDTTHGMNVWQLPLSDLHTDEIEREVWLWDFAGQPDYRLIHQLFMDETALAVMVIDPQNENPLEPLAHWEKALSIAVKNPPPKLLVAGRCERGGVTVSQAKLDQYCAERGYEHFQITSAKSGEGCTDLKDAIAKHIPWNRLPWISTSTLFKALKDAIIRIKQEEIALIRFAELQQRLELELKETIKETDLRAVVGLLGGQWLIKPIDFGDFILLRPEEINKYASLIAHQARESSDDIGCISEKDVLKGNLKFPADVPRLKSSADEEILLRAIVETFVNRSLCIREETLDGTKLVFPSYFKQERDEIKDHPNVFVTYGFSGMLDEIYSTLVVRLHYTNDFEKDQLWKYAADFKTFDGKRVGLQMHKKSEGEAKIIVYFETDVHIVTQLSFIKYIHEHLLKKAKDVTRVRSYVCPHCGEPLENRKAIRVRLEKGLKDIACGFCEERVLLVDMIEEKFASDEFSRAVRKMDEDAQINLDNESLELILVGHAFTTVGEAGHIFRPTANSDWGIDGEIEFKDTEEIIDEDGNAKVITKASGERVYLQLKSGDSYLRQRKRDEKEIFTIKSPRWAEYWQSHKYPVMLVIRTSDGRIRWMNVTEYLQNHGADTKQIEFDGEMFTALNVAKMRDRILR